MLITFVNVTSNAEAVTIYIVMWYSLEPLYLVTTAKEGALALHRTVTLDGTSLTFEIVELFCKVHFELTRPRENWILFVF